jgi:hypothetical protein
MLNKINERINSINLFLMLLLLTSPALSVLGLFLGSFIPNQRIAFAFTTVLLLNQRFPIKRDYIKFWCISITMILIIMLRLAIYPQDTIADTSDAGLIIFLGTLPAFIEFFHIKKKYLFKSLLAIIYLQISVAIFQNIMMSAGLVDIANMFDNYHILDAKVIYVYPQIISGFYRTSGLFIESSQYSIFLCFCSVCINTIATNAWERKIAKYTQYIIMIAILINASITAYLIILFVLLANPKKNSGTISFLALVIAVIVYLSVSVSELSSNNEYLSKKITANTTGVSKDSDESEGERTTSFFNHFDDLIKNRPIFGYGDLKIENNRWDFVSTYLYGYGVSGFIIMIITVLFILNKAPIDYYIILLLSFTTNGNLQTPMFLMMIPVIFIAKEMRLKTKTIHF